MKTSHKIARVRARWLELEHEIIEIGDPEAIEHATIAAIAMRHLDERVREIDELELDVEQELADALEREMHGTVAEYERELFGVDEAVA
jgi:hypothetical protein